MANLRYLSFIPSGEKSVSLNEGTGGVTQQVFNINSHAHNNKNKSLWWKQTDLGLLCLDS